MARRMPAPSFATLTRYPSLDKYCWTTSHISFWSSTTRIWPVAVMAWVNLAQLPWRCNIAQVGILGGEIRLRRSCASDTRRYNLLHISGAADIKQLQALGTVNSSRGFTLNTVWRCQRHARREH